MTILIFVIILAVLILVHEFGHFIVAKKSGIRVDEFGIGFPPRIATLFKWQGTRFSLNAIPFGGFVKIFGENPEEAPKTEEEEKEHFSHKSRGTQALVLVAGIVSNILLAWVLISFGFFYGIPTTADSQKYPVSNPELTILNVLNDSPAELGGLLAGDIIVSATAGKNILESVNPENFSKFVSENGDLISLSIVRGEKNLEVNVLPESGIVEDKKAIGISMGMVGTLKLPLHLAIWEGTKTTANLLIAVAVGLVGFLGQAITGQADFSQVAGPVGIVGLVGDASRLGFIYLLQFTAFISLNLAVINLIPFPALDGGRLFILAIEAIRRKNVNPRFANILNAIGFILLIFLMVAITIHDIARLF